MCFTPDNGIKASITGSHRSGDECKIHVSCSSGSAFFYQEDFRRIVERIKEIGFYE